MIRLHEPDKRALACVQLEEYISDTSLLHQKMRTKGGLTQANLKANYFCKLLKWQSLIDIYRMKIFIEGDHFLARSLPSFNIT